MDNVDTSPGVVLAYSDYKAAVFARYCMLSEMLGIILVCESVTAKKLAVAAAEVAVVTSTGM